MSNIVLHGSSTNARLNVALALLALRTGERATFAPHVAHMSARHAAAGTLVEPLLLLLPSSLLASFNALFVADVLESAVHAYAERVGAPTCVAQKAGAVDVCLRVPADEQPEIAFVGPLSAHHEDVVFRQTPSLSEQPAAAGERVRVLVRVMGTTSVAIISVDVRGALERAAHYCVVCEHCGADESARHLLLCGGCEVTFYCSPECQRKQRASHRSMCARLRQPLADR